MCSIYIYLTKYLQNLTFEGRFIVIKMGIFIQNRVNFIDFVNVFLSKNSYFFVFLSNFV